MITVAIVGTGGMAHAHVRRFMGIRGCRVVAGVDIDRERAEAFCCQYGIAHSYGSVIELLDHCRFDAAAVVTPDAFHVPCALPLVRAGKHVLCEKPLAPTAWDARKLVVAARKSGVINMVNFSYRDAPALHKAHQLVADGRLGRIMHLEASYLQTWLTSPVWGEWTTSPNWLWRLSTAHGSTGALGDIGVHIVDFATYAAHQDLRSVNAALKALPKAPRQRIGQYVLDANDSAILQVELAGGGLGVITATRWASGQVNSLLLDLYGDRGGLRLNLDRSHHELEVCLGRDLARARWRTVRCPKTPSIHQRFITGIRTGRNDQPDFARGWRIQRIIDASIQSDTEARTIRIR